MDDIDLYIYTDKKVYVKYKHVIKIDKAAAYFDEILGEQESEAVEALVDRNDI